MVVTVKQKESNIFYNKITIRKNKHLTYVRISFISDDAGDVWTDVLSYRSWTSLRILNLGTHNYQLEKCGVNEDDIIALAN